MLSCATSPRVVQEGRASREADRWVSKEVQHISGDLLGLYGYTRKSFPSSILIKAAISEE